MRVPPEAAAPESPPPRPTLVVRASLSRGPAPAADLQARPFYWRDLVSGPPPRRHARGGVHVTYHSAEEGGDVRIAHGTLVQVDVKDESSGEEVVLVEERVSVQRRALHEFLDRERAFSDRLARRLRGGLSRNLVRQRRFANRLTVGWLVSFLLWCVRIQAHVGQAVINGTQRFLRALVRGPDALLTRIETASFHLQSRSGRRGIWTAFLNPAAAGTQEKSIVLLLVSGALFGMVLLLNSAFALVFVAQAPVYKHIVGDFTASLLSVLALPLPSEPLLIYGTITSGPFVAATGLFLGKVVGSWMLYLIGDSLFDTIKGKTAGRPRFAAMIAWMQRNANRWGFWMLVVINAIPLMPDVLVYVFAVSGMKFRSFMAGIAVGAAIKYAILIAAVYIVGPEQILYWLSHPIDAMRGGGP